MDYAYILFLILASVVIPILGIVVVRGIIRSDPYQFDLVLMRPGVNDHVRITGDSLEFEYEHLTKKYKIQADRLYRVRVGHVMNLVFWMRGIKKRFFVGFQHKKTTPIKASGDISVTSRILKEVEESRALGKALRSEFSLGLDMKKILLIMGFVVVVIIAYVLVSGGIVL